METKVGEPPSGSDHEVVFKLGFVADTGYKPLSSKLIEVQMLEQVVQA